MSRQTTEFECQSCGYSSPKWLGRCPDCGSWNSFLEEKRSTPKLKTSANVRPAARPVRLSEVSSEDAPRILTSNGEFDRVLGGGIVPGSLVLLGGEPGVGKSTLLLQISRALQDKRLRVLYVSGEESAQQIKMRAERLEQPRGAGDQGPAVGEEKPAPDEIYLLAEACMERIFEAVVAIRPAALVVDSVQTTYSESLDSAPGSISQVRHVAAQLLNLAKSDQIPIFLIGHVTKDGSLAGPKALEHIVDAVLYFEGERHHNHRIVRAVKNRFGAADELGIFEMTSRGLLPVQNPSALFVTGMESGSPGSAVICALEGTRPILVEVQALVSSSQYSTARRVSTGMDYNRISVMVAMLEKRLGFHLMGCDIYVNAAGGLEIHEPAADLGIVAAILSSFRNRPLKSRTVLLGELGLSGEVRPVAQVFPRIREAGLMGFQHCVVPSGNLPLLDSAQGIEVVPVKTISELSDLVFEI